MERDHSIHSLSKNHQEEEDEEDEEGQQQQHHHHHHHEDFLLLNRMLCPGLRLAIRSTLSNSVMNIAELWKNVYRLEQLECIRRWATNEMGFGEDDPISLANVKLEKKFEKAWIGLKRLLFSYELTHPDLSRRQARFNKIFSPTPSQNPFSVTLKHISFAQCRRSFSNFLLEQMDSNGHNEKLESFMDFIPLPKVVDEIYVYIEKHRVYEDLLHRRLLKDRRRSERPPARLLEHSLKKKRISL